MQLLYKIMSAAEWALTERTGVFEGSAVDHRDGFIHLSAAHQVRETAQKHFAGQQDLMLVALGADFLENLKWEPSRSGDLFPHVYGSIPVAAVAWAKPLPLAGGAHAFPDEAGG
jgi:uncharacterized protein (DUF952 family)